MALGILHAAIDLVYNVFSIPIFKDHQKQYVFTWKSQEYTFISCLRAVSILLSGIT